jgi:hypothetical protein
MTAIRSRRLRRRKPAEEYGPDRGPKRRKSVGGSVRGENPLSRGAEASRTRVHLGLRFPGSVFPTLQAFKVCTASSRGERGGTAAELTGDVAQLGEHLPCTQGVTGSSPVISTRTLSTE